MLGSKAPLLVIRTGKLSSFTIENKHKGYTKCSKLSQLTTYNSKDVGNGKVNLHPAQSAQINFEILKFESLSRAHLIIFMHMDYQAF